MAKSRARRSSSKLPIILGSLIILGALWYGISRLSPATPVDIFVVTNPLEYGDVTQLGILRKNAPVGESGTYYLATKEGYYIELDAQGLDGLIGSPVTVSGYLTPRVDESSYPTMAVSTITVADSL